MTKTRGIVYGLLIVVGLCCFWWVRHKKDVQVDTQTRSTVLPPQDEAKLVISPRSHTIEIIRKEGITKTFLPDAGASVDVRKSGGVIVTSRKWGTEIDPTLGFTFGGDIRLRASLGLNVFYVYRWEAGAAVLLNSDIHDTRAMLRLGYNVYDNLLVSIGYDTRRTPQLDFSFKF